MTTYAQPEEPQVRTLLAAATLIPGALLAAQNNASGTLTLQGQTVTIRHAYAVQIPDWFEKTKFGTRLVLSDSPIQASAIPDYMELVSLARAGRIHAIQFEIGAGGSSFSMSVLSTKIPGSLSVSKNFDVRSLKVFNPVRIEGSLSAPASTLGGMQYQYDVQFAADIAPHTVPKPPTAADASAAARAASAQAYLAFTAALRAGNKAKLLELASPQVRRMIDQPDFAEKLSFIQAMMPGDIRVLKAEENGEEAKLTVSGTEDGKTKSGTVTMQRVDGKWLMVKESWKSSM